MSETGFRILAATRCHTDSCCPAVMESADGENIVIVGSAVSALLSSASVKQRVGEGEAAVAIPKSLLLEAFNAMLYSNIKNS